MNRWVGLIALATFAVMTLGACGSSPVSSAAPSNAVVPITLREAPAGIGCDTIGVPYNSVTIRIDAAAPDQVWALTDADARLEVHWAKGFVGGTSADPTVADPAGQIVARDGDQIVIPEGAWPRLHGHFVCPGTTAIYILLQDPA